MRRRVDTPLPILSHQLSSHPSFNVLLRTLQEFIKQLPTLCLARMSYGTTREKEVKLICRRPTFTKHNSTGLVTLFNVPNKNKGFTKYKLYFQRSEKKSCVCRIMQFCCILYLYRENMFYYDAALYFRNIYLLWWNVLFHIMYLN